MSGPPDPPSGSAHAVRAKENPKVSIGVPSHRQASGTGPQMKAMSDSSFILRLTGTMN